MNFNALGDSQADAPEIFQTIFRHAHKFDIVEWKLLPKEMIAFGSMLCEDGVFKTPFPYCVFAAAYDLLEQQLAFDRNDSETDDVDVKWQFLADPEAKKIVGYWTKNLAIETWELEQSGNFQSALRSQLKDMGSEMNCDFFLTVYADYSRNRGWIKLGSIVLDQGCDIFWLPNDTCLIKESEEDRKLEAQFHYIMAKAALWGLFGAVACLSSKSVKQTIVPAPEKLNRARAKRGKLPIYEYRKITIGRGADAIGSYEGKSVEGRASPRLHWRRGHYRTLPSNVRVPVSPTLVGLSENGFIDKDYIIRNPNRR